LNLRLARFGAKPLWSLSYFGFRQKDGGGRAFFNALTAGNAFERKGVFFILEHGFFGAEADAGKASDAFVFVYYDDSGFISAYGFGRAYGNANSALGACYHCFFFFRLVFPYSKTGAFDFLGFEKNVSAGFFALMAGRAQFGLFAKHFNLHT